MRQPVYSNELVYLDEVFPKASFLGLREWYLLGGDCSKCGHGAVVDRHELAQQFGSETVIASLQPKLRCCRCGSKGKSRWVIQKMPR
jgi:uncharacterized OB-fold protein